MDLNNLVDLVSSLATIGLVLLTYSAVRSGRAAAEAAAESARLAEQQLQEAHRPLLIPTEPQKVGSDVVVSVHNIGVGPAIRVYGYARLQDLPPSVPCRFARFVTPGAPAGGITALRFNAATVALAKLLSVEITYRDTGGRSYTTHAKWDKRHTTFTNVRVREGEGFERSPAISRPLADTA